MLTICFYGYGYHRDLHVLTPSFPPRRSSYLAFPMGSGAAHPLASAHGWEAELVHCAPAAAECCTRLQGSRRFVRSEEHTSELQSLMRISYAVFCLKKKDNITNQYSLR